MMPMRLVTTAIALGSAVALAACGGDSSESAARESADPKVALTEARKTREALSAALATYKSGDRQAAEEQVAEAYVSHFEHVEGALEQKDHELNERLEEAISGDLRDAIKAGRPASVVESQVDAVVADLRTAEGALR